MAFGLLEWEMYYIENPHTHWHRTSFAAKRNVFRVLSLQNARHAASSSQNSILLHDLCRTVCELLLWNLNAMQQICRILRWWRRHSTLLCKLSRLFCYRPQFITSLAQFCSASHCLQRYLLLETLSHNSKLIQTAASGNFWWIYDNTACMTFIWRTHHTKKKRPG